jgi:hypothetical protein
VGPSGPGGVSIIRAGSGAVVPLSDPPPARDRASPAASHKGKRFIARAAAHGQGHDAIGARRAGAEAAVIPSEAGSGPLLRPYPPRITTHGDTRAADQTMSGG